MITRLYNTDEDPALCSVIWGTNFSSGITITTTTSSSASESSGPGGAITTTTLKSSDNIIFNTENNNSYSAINTFVNINHNTNNSNNNNNHNINNNNYYYNNNNNNNNINSNDNDGNLNGFLTFNTANGISSNRNDDMRDNFFIPIDDVEDPRTEALREYSYGIILPIICALGIIGNVLNLIVLTRRNMRGTAYIYMRAYSTAALLAIVFAIPFDMRMLVHKDRGRWQDFLPAFYTAHLELFLGNGCLGVGVMMLLVLTIERYVSVCHPGFTRPVMGPPGLVVFLTTLITFIIYMPSVFRGELIKCVLQANGNYVYLRRDNEAFLRTLFYSVYKVMLEVIFKLIPTVLIAGLNFRIMMVYRRTCEKRRKMILTRSTYIKDEDPRKFAEERRLFLLLGSTSILFLLCVSPMAILHMTIASEVLPSFSFQVFRALANVLELVNYSITFYIYCLFSEDFRNTLIRTIKWPWIKTNLCHHVDEVSTKATPLMNFDKITLRNHHITTTSGVCTGVGRSSSI